MHDLYFEPKYEESWQRTIWSLSNAFTSAFKELDPIPQFKATATLGEFLEVPVLTVVLTGRAVTRSLLFINSRDQLVSVCAEDQRFIRVTSQATRFSVRLYSLSLHCSPHGCQAHWGRTQAQPSTSPLHSELNLSRLSWKWRKRSSVKIAERTYEQRAQALHS